MAERSSGIFRRQALEIYVGRKSETGSPLRIAPGWTRWIYWLLVAFFLAGLSYGIVGRVNEYAQGLATVRVEGGGEACAVRALLPARFAPAVREVAEARFFPDGFPGTHEQVALERAAEPRIVSSVEALRELGLDGIGAALEAGPSVLVQGDLPDCRLEYQGDAIPYGEGMRGKLELRVSSERILLTLIPGLKRLAGSAS